MWSDLTLCVCVAAELSLTVPIINSTAFLFTVLGEWYVERKVIEKGKQAFILPPLD